MEKILIFSGTTEGRELSSYFNELGIETYVSVATEYGKECMGEGEFLHTLSGRMTEQEMCSFLKEKKITLVIDATHPFACVVTENIKTSCNIQKVPYLRCIRERCDQAKVQDDMVFAESIQGAVEYLRTTSGNILIATGSKELDLYTTLENYKERCYARVLSTLESVEKSIRLGFAGSHLLAMQGPFSEEMNIATLRQVHAEWFVTKDSGKTGGYGEKIRAARAVGAKLVIIRRPEEDGKTLQEVKEYVANHIADQKSEE